MCLLGRLPGKSAAALLLLLLPLLLCGMLAAAGSAATTPASVCLLLAVINSRLRACVALVTTVIVEADLQLHAAGTTSAGCRSGTWQRRRQLRCAWLPCRRTAEGLPVLLRPRRVLGWWCSILWRVPLHLHCCLLLPVSLPPGPPLLLPLLLLLLLLLLLWVVVPGAAVSLLFLISPVVPAGQLLCRQACQLCCCDCCCGGGASCPWYELTRCLLRCLRLRGSGHWQTRPQVWQHEGLQNVCVCVWGGGGGVGSTHVSTVGGEQVQEG